MVPTYLQVEHGIERAAISFTDVLRHWYERPPVRRVLRNRRRRNGNHKRGVIDHLGS